MTAACEGGCLCGTVRDVHDRSGRDSPYAEQNHPLPDIPATNTQQEEP